MFVVVGSKFGRFDKLSDEMVMDFTAGHVWRNGPLVMSIQTLTRNFWDVWANISFTRLLKWKFIYRQICYINMTNTIKSRPKDRVVHMNQMLIVCLLKNQWGIAMWLLAINFKRSTKWKIIFFQKTLKKVINFIPFQDKNIFEKQNQKLSLLNLAKLVSIPAVL